MTGEYSTRISLVAAFMLASNTPGVPLRASSMRVTHSAQYYPLTLSRRDWPSVLKPAVRIASTKSVDLARAGSYSIVARPVRTLTWTRFTPGKVCKAFDNAGPPERLRPCTGSSSLRGPFTFSAIPVVADDTAGVYFSGAASNCFTQFSEQKYNVWPLDWRVVKASSGSISIPQTGSFTGIDDPFTRNIVTWQK